MNAEILKCDSSFWKINPRKKNSKITFSKINFFEFIQFWALFGHSTF